MDHIKAQILNKIKKKKKLYCRIFNLCSIFKEKEREVDIPKK